MTNYKKSIGALGERLARTKLEDAGLTIVETNWRCARGEIDIVAQDGAEWVFVEVKTRTNDKFGTPEDSITPKKKQRMALVGEHYIDTHDIDAAWRIDLVAITFDASRTLQRITHYPDIVGF